MNSDIKVAIVGCGALGSFYGAKLCHLGCSTHFLLRSDHDVVRRRGVWIRSDLGDLKVRPRCAQHPSDIGPVDLVLIGLKTTANDQFPRLLPPLVGEHTVVLTLQNGLGNEESLAQLVDPRHIMGGLCFVCLNRTQPGVIRHLAHGNIVLGEYARWPEPRTHDVAGLFRKAGVPCKVTEDLARAHWEKLVWNIPFNGLGVASSAGFESLEQGHVKPETACAHCLTTQDLLADERWSKWILELMHEVIRAARAQGFAIATDLAETMIAKTRRMGAYKASTVLDFERGHALELDALFRKPWSMARAAGVETPILGRLCGVLDDLEKRARRGASGA